MTKTENDGMLPLINPPPFLWFFLMKLRRLSGLWGSREGRGRFAPRRRRIGKPVDFLVFKGMDDQHIDEVVFVEIKSGNSQLSPNERTLRYAIEAKRVRWQEYRVDHTIADMPAPTDDNHPPPAVSSTTNAASTPQ
jgi:hypothetical protein